MITRDLVKELAKSKVLCIIEGILNPYSCFEPWLKFSATLFKYTKTFHR